MSLDFTAIDFETANQHRASACAVGLVRVRDGKIADEKAWLIQPPPGFAEFSHWNVRVHHITPDMVASAPPWRRVAGWITDFAGDDLLVAHNAPFDASVLRQACSAVGLPVPRRNVLCTLDLARRACSLSSNRLPYVAAEFGVRLGNHHDALADARCAAEIAVAMAHRHGHDKLEQLAQSLGVTLRPVG